MILKKITNLLGIVAIGLMMGSSISYAVKGYGLLDASGDWARLIASNIASSSSSSSQSGACPPGVDITKYTCKAKEAWVVRTVNVTTDRNGNGSFEYNKFSFNVSGQAASANVSVAISVPECSSDPINVCLKTFVTENAPKIIK